jgi:hypothetical protein
MSLLEPKVFNALKNAKLPQGLNRLSVPGSKIPFKSYQRILNWLQVSGNPNLDLYSEDPSRLDGWFTISDSEEYGRTLWGPSIAADPTNNNSACLVLGSSIYPLFDLKDCWSVTADEESGFCVEWHLGDQDYVSVPVRIIKDVKVSLKELRTAISNGAVAAILPKPVIYYPKLPTLPVGEYKVISYFQYPGYSGPAYGLEIQYPSGQTEKFQGNRTTTETLSLSPVITTDRPATLKVLSHSRTQQGYPMAIVSLHASFDDLEEFDFTADFHTLEKPMLMAATDDELVIDIDIDLTEPELEPELETELEPELETEVIEKPVTKRKRSR